MIRRVFLNQAIASNPEPYLVIQGILFDKVEVINQRSAVFQLQDIVQRAVIVRHAVVGQVANIASSAVVVPSTIGNVLQVAILAVFQCVFVVQRAGVTDRNIAGQRAAVIDTVIAVEPADNEA